MMFWVLAATLTSGSLAALYYASRAGGVNAREGNAETAARSHFRARLVEIGEAVAAERLTSAEAEVARGELARELMRQEMDDQPQRAGAAGATRYVPIAAIAFVALSSFGLYFMVGRPELPAVPLAGRELPQVADIDVDDAVAQVEAALEANPDDARGWAAIGPVYMQLGRFEDATHAFRRVMELAPVTADTETDLAEAIMMAQGGSAEGEPLALLKSAAAREPDHIRSRFYLAGEATRAGEFEEAVKQWQGLMALGTGDEPWADVARRGLETAIAGSRGEPLPAAPEPLSPDPDQEEMIRGMVEGLSGRLMADGGSLDQWTQLVRSRLVLGEVELAQQAYTAAKLAYPDPAARGELDALAAGAGLE